MKATKFKASVYQEAIFRKVASFSTDIVVSAVAGSGKSTTLKQLLDYIPPVMNVLYLAFNTDAAKSLGDKLSSYAQEKRAAGEEVCNYTSSTIHSLGNGTLRSAGIASKPKSNKYNILCKNYLSKYLPTPKYTSQFAKLVDMVRLTLSETDEQSLLVLMDRFEIDIPIVYLTSEDEGELVETPEWAVIKVGVAEILKQGIRLAQTANEYDFTDMVWLPSSKAMNLTPKQYDWVLCDEAQDLSPAARELVLRAKKGHFIGVGDRKQAIYGFCGASLQSIDEIIEATGAIEMPLSICYRCPKAVIDMANTVWPGTEARPDAPNGVVDRIPSDKVSGMVQVGDLILCRLTAPLVQKCLELLRLGVRANVRGKDLGSQFASLLENIKKFSYTSEEELFIDLIGIAQEYQRKQTAILGKNADNEMAIDSLKDRVETLKALHQAYLNSSNLTDMAGFQEYIKAFFQSDSNAQVILSTGHRAKGLEYRRVFILQSDKIPHSKAKSADALTQEYNLMYVMYTRATEELYLVVDFVPAPEEQSIDAPALPVDQEDVDSLIVTPKSESVKPIIDYPKKSDKVGGRVAEKLAKEGVLLPKMISVGYRFSNSTIQRINKAAQMIADLGLPEVDKSGLAEKAVNKELDLLFSLLGEENNGPDPDDNGGGGAPLPVEEPQQTGNHIDAIDKMVTIPSTVEDATKAHPIMATLRQAMHFDDEVDPEQIVRRFYVCSSCKHKWGYDYHRDHQTYGLYRMENGQRITADQDAKCTKCPNDSKYTKKRTLKVKHNVGKRCTASCRNATSNDCECSCNGAMHGSRHMLGVLLLKVPTKEKTA